MDRVARDLQLIRPDWPAPACVQALATTREGGISSGRFASLNLGLHVSDDPQRVAANRSLLEAAAQLPAAPRWLEQVHGRRVVTLAEARGPVETADGAMTAVPGVVCAVLTADCLPVLFCDRDGRRVAAVHAGWRGLAADILEQAVAGFAAAGSLATQTLAWLGPAIGPAAYEVGQEVRDAFVAPGDAAAFTASPRGRWQLDLYALARGRLAAAGVTAVYGGQFCTHAESRFFSYRRVGACGRQATLIWLATGASR